MRLYAKWLLDVLKTDVKLPSTVQMQTEMQNGQRVRALLRQQIQSIISGEKMNGYDFDGTIFKGDSFRRFYFYSLVRFPYIILLLPFQLIAALLRAMRILNKHAFLSAMSVFLAFVPAKKMLEKFWDKNMKHVKKWYLEQKKYNDVIVSASPYFLVAEACRRLSVDCIATDMSYRGKTNGKHCYGQQKVDMFKSKYMNKLETYYSDSFSDIPMFLFANEGYFVKGNKIKLAYKNGVRQKGIYVNEEEYLKEARR